MSLLPDKELRAVEVWFGELKVALELSPNADRGRVLASVRKLVAENERYETEKGVVAAAYGYKRWGDLYSLASAKLAMVPEVELPEVFSKPPNGVVFRPGGNYDKAEKHLVKTRLRLKEVWSHIEDTLAAEPTTEAEEWATEQRKFFVKEFEATTDFDEFDKTCLAFVRNYEEEDPATTWVEVAGTAEVWLEDNYDLPSGVVTELISYAENKGVEATKSVVAMNGRLRAPANEWLYYLLAAYLCETRRPDSEDVWRVGRLFLDTTQLWGCYEEVSANDPDYPSMQKRSYDQSLTLAQVVAAVRQMVELSKEVDFRSTRDDWKRAIQEAVGLVTGEKKLMVTPQS